MAPVRKSVIPKASKGNIDIKIILETCHQQADILALHMAHLTHDMATIEILKWWLKIVYIYVNWYFPVYICKWNYSV